MNQLKPEINRNEWTEEEDLIIWKMYKKMGSKWTEIAKKLTQRTVFHKIIYLGEHGKEQILWMFKKKIWKIR